MSAPDQPTNDEAMPVPQYRGLKTAVIIMGVLLVIGFIVVFSTIIYRAVKLGDEPQSAQSKAGGPVYELNALIPPGGKTGTIVLADDRLAVEIMAQQSHYILLFDVRRGRELGRINLTKQ